MLYFSTEVEAISSVVWKFPFESEISLTSTSTASNGPSSRRLPRLVNSACSLQRLRHDHPEVSFGLDKCHVSIAGLLLRPGYLCLGIIAAAKDATFGVVRMNGH